MTNNLPSKPMTKTSPNYQCPLCFYPFRALKEAPMMYDWEDIAQHYWWHKLERLKALGESNA